MTNREKCILVEIYGVIDIVLGDTDPDTYGLTRKEIKEEEPIFWVAQEIAKLIGDGPWDKYKIRGDICKECGDKWIEHAKQHTDSMWMEHTSLDGILNCQRSIEKAIVQKEESENGH